MKVHQMNVGFQCSLYLSFIDPWTTYIYFGRNDAKAETPILWSSHAKSWLIGKDPDARRDWGQEEKGTTEDEMAGMASLTRCTWIWVDSGNWWWTGRPGVLRFMGSQRVRHDWATELNYLLTLSCGWSAVSHTNAWVYFWHNMMHPIKMLSNKCYLNLILQLFILRKLKSKIPFIKNKWNLD